MSNIGLNANTFSVTGKYLDILTDFVVKARTSGGINDAKKDQLVEFITKISDKENTEPQFQLLTSIIERELRNHRNKKDAFFAAMLSALQSNNMLDLVPRVEFIIEALDTENSEALSKIKGE